jgi:hypothetical protein
VPGPVRLVDPECIVWTAGDAVIDVSLGGARTFKLVTSILRAITTYDDRISAEVIVDVTGKLTKTAMKAS